MTGAPAAPAATSRLSGHRPDIDGLRAVAILPVLLFHAHVPGFRGGFVGVDVFFVISGYLITGILCKDIARDRFSILRFYERRIRRIFPALMAMLGVVAAVGYAWLLPQELRPLARSLIPATLFVSNIFFFREVGYFNGASELKPLLHTWSLAVEEQFYIFFPLYLWAVSKKLRQPAIVKLTAALALASLALATWATWRNPKAAFFLAPHRANELLLGALIALDALRAPSGQRSRDLLSLAGLALILGSVVGYSDTTRFPGLTALLPCLGAGAIIHAGKEGRSLVGRWLATRPLVSIGLVSYSLYLWHWPILALARTCLMRKLTTPEIAGALGTACLLAILSWRFVERPFRRPDAVLRRRGIFALAGVAMLACLAFGRLTYNGSPWRFRVDRTKLAEITEPDDFDCQGRATSSKADVCPIGAPTADPPTFVVWGDSHARVFYRPLDRLAAANGEAGLFFGINGCAPLLGVGLVESDAAPGFSADCAAQNRKAFAAITSAGRIRDVVLVARWPYYLWGTGFAADSFHHTEVFDEGGARLSLPEIEDRAVRTVRALLTAGKSVYLVETVPELTVDPLAVCGRALLFHRSLAGFEQPRQPVEDRGIPLHAIVDRLASEPRFHFVATHDLFCDGLACRMERDGRPLYSDNNHVGPLASPLLEPRLSPIFARLALQPAAPPPAPRLVPAVGDSAGVEAAKQDGRIGARRRPDF
jgi:peptidoglycan/LPS O-acetylase OafA/YrhL